MERGRREPDRGEGRRRKERKYLVDYCALLVIDSDSGSGFLFVSFCPVGDPSLLPSLPCLLTCRREVKAEWDNDEWVGVVFFVVSPYLQVGDFLATNWST